MRQSLTLTQDNLDTLKAAFQATFAGVDLTREDLNAIYTSLVNLDVLHVRNVLTLAGLPVVDHENHFGGFVFDKHGFKVQVCREDDMFQFEDGARPCYAAGIPHELSQGFVMQLLNETDHETDRTFYHIVISLNHNKFAV